VTRPGTVSARHGVGEAGDVGCASAAVPMVKKFSRSFTAENVCRSWRTRYCHRILGCQSLVNGVKTYCALASPSRMFCPCESSRKTHPGTGQLSTRSEEEIRPGGASENGDSVPALFVEAV